jgi:hypothetical protein
MDKIRVPISITVEDLTDREEIKTALKEYALANEIERFNPTQIIKVTSKYGSTVQSDTPNTVFILPLSSEIDNPKLSRLQYPTNTYRDVFDSHKVGLENKTFQQIWDSLNPVDYYNDGDLAHEYDVPDGGSLRKKRRKSYSKKKRKVKRKTKKRRKSKTKKRR